MCERDYSGRAYSNWRNEIVWGEVHDGNAHFLGGAAGHAGLFSNASETLRWQINSSVRNPNCFRQKPASCFDKT